MQGMHSEVLNILLSRGEWNGSEKPSGWVGGAWHQERERERLEKVPEQTTQGPGGSAGAVGQHHQRRWLPAGQEKEGVSRRKARGLGSRDLMWGPHSSLWGGRWEAAGTDGEKRRVTSSYLPKRDLCQLQVAEFIWIDNFQWKFPPSPEIRAWQIKHILGVESALWH